MYQENSLKNDTRESRGIGQGTQRLVRHDTPIQHKKFKDFLRANDNKTKLFNMTADVVTCKYEEGILICTKDDKVLANSQITKSNLEPCNHEKVYTRLSVHAQYAALTNMQKVMIIRSDTGIVVIALCIFWAFKIGQLWIKYGCGKNHWWLPIHNYVKLGKKSAEHCHFSISSQDAIVFHHFAEEEKRLHGIRGAVSLNLLNAF